MFQVNCPYFSCDLQHEDLSMLCIHTTQYAEHNCVLFFNSQPVSRELLVGELY